MAAETTLEDLVWTKKDGTKIKLGDMTDSHLRNAARFLRRKASDELSSLYSAGCMVQGDGATYAWESAVHSLDETNAKRHLVANAMEEVLQKRKASAGGMTCN